ncbi:MAG: carbohydrate ABC transporter permease [Limnochordia bacterium]|jgi:raffinose/stachyose/melibiose transport system permease protein|nr:carbohydrate ABC transporter permease [Limnochordia bacterium]
MHSRRYLWQKGIRETLTYLLLFGFALFFVYPIFLMVVSAFKSTREIFADPFGLPAVWRFENFVTVWSKARFNIYFLNSVVVTLISTVLVLLLSSLSAFALSRYKFRLNSFFYMFFLAGIMIPIRLGILPLFVVMRNLNLINTHWSLILTYVSSGMPMSVFLLTGFLKTIPNDLEASARIDGCSDLRIFYQIMLPLIRPGLATVALVNSIPWWNDFFFPLLYIQADRLKTVPLGMTLFFGQYMTDWSLLFAGMVIASIPLLIMYVTMSKQFISGLTAGALKG